MDESLVVFVSLVGRGGEEQQRVAVLTVADFLGQAIVLRALDLAGAAIVGRAQLVGFVKK